MTEPAPTTDPHPAAPAEPAATSKLPLEQIALGALALLSVIGLAVADFSSRQSLRYWIFMVPIFAGVSIFSGWSRARSSGQSVPTILRQQLLHWSVLPIAVYLVYALQATGRLNREDAGLVALLALALTTFLAGVHFDWRLAVLGVALAAAAVVAAMVEEFFWIFLLIAVPIVALAVWLKRRSSRTAKSAEPTPTD